MGAERLTATLTRRVLLTSAMLLVAVPVIARDAIGSVDTIMTAPDGRAVPVRITWPTKGVRRLPLLVLSHGANGTLDGLVLLQRSLTRGRIVAAPRHPDSEANPDLAKVDRGKVFGQRIADMKLVLDGPIEIERLTGKRIDTTRITAGGHSFGALIAQALGGAKVGAPAQDWRDARITRVVAFSPPGPIPGYAESVGWAAMAVPQFVQTGTADVVPMMAPQWQAHMTSFDTAAVRGSALWIGNGVDHYFGNRIQRLSRVAPDQGAGFRRAVDLADEFLRGASLKTREDVTGRLAVK
jgi:hypothetical protein